MAAPVVRDRLIANRSGLGAPALQRGAASVVRDRQIANMSGTGEPALQGRGMHGSRRALPRLDAFCENDVGEGQALALR